MNSPSNRLQTFKFTQQSFFDEINRLSDRQMQAPSLQMDYLFRYLQQSGARSLIVEDHYIDRYYIDEYTSWYAKCFNHTKNYTGRIHLFSQKFDDFNSFIKRAGSGEFPAVREELQKTYLGYVVIRPLPSVPIGRTVLQPWWFKPDRIFNTVNPTKVHLAGIDLTVKGLAFQQQDIGVGACATTAVWCALQRVAKADGLRAPTPPEITASAYKFYMPFGRPDPSPGFTQEQIAEALRSHGFTPHFFKAYNSVNTSLACLYTYLNSGIPVIISIFNGDLGHAVTAVGFQMHEKDKINSAKMIEYGNLGLKWIGSQIEKIYIHDDRLGPYARAKLEAAQRKTPSGDNLNYLKMMIEFPGGNEEWEVAGMWVPLYPKLRRSALGLMRIATQYFGTLISITQSNELSFETKFQRGGMYQQELYSRRLNPDLLTAFMNKVTLSRYVGILTVYLRNLPLCEFVLDTTDTDRSSDIEKPMAVVCLDPAFQVGLEPLASVFNSPFVA